MSLIKLIKDYKRKNRILFTTPSHNQGSFIIPESLKFLGKDIFKNDFSEIEGFDNLQNPDGAILESEKKAADIYGSQTSFYLINGSTSGIIALMLAVLKPNDKVLIARNCHKSVYNSLVLSGALPVWVTSEYNDEWGIFKHVSPKDVEKAFVQNPDIKAFILTNPTYEGMIADIEKISLICKEHNAVLIVDEAHGALWNFDKTIGTPALYLKADAAVQSLHKTGGALNPSAILHISQESKIDKNKVKDALNLINTTSPSYPLLLNIETTINFLNSKKGKKQISQLTDNIIEFKNSLKKFSNIHIYYENNDITKILIKIDGLSGFELSDILFNKYKIEDELANEKSVLFLTGIGTSKAKLKKLKNALIKTANKTAKDILKKANEADESAQIESENKSRFLNYPAPQVVCSPLQAFNKPFKLIKKEDAAGQISQEVIIEYPPGIPLLLPGELIQEGHLTFFKDNEKIKIMAD